MPPLHQFNQQRLQQLRNLLDIQYEKLGLFEEELLMADGIAQRVAVRQQIKRQIVPLLRKHEQEYAELLVAGVPDDAIPEDEADALVNELREAADQTTASGAEIPEPMQTLLQEIRDKLDEPGKSATAKLKVALPILPGLVSYDLELDTENLITNVWRKARDFFKGFISENPQ